MPEAPSISIVMPIFNTRRYLAEAVESVLAQTYEDWELLLIDDGSSDGSGDLARSFIARRPGRIRVLTHPDGKNHGISATRNLGVRNAQGRYIACLDSDDWWFPNTLAVLAENAKAHPEASMVVGATEYWYPSEPERNWLLPVGAPQDALTMPPALFSLLYPVGEGAAPSANTLLLKKDVVERLGGWEDRFRTAYEDQAFLCKLYLTEPVYVSSHCCDRYRQHGASIMATELVGDSYYRNRHRFLRWLERTMRARKQSFPNEWKATRAALESEELYPYQHPVRFSLGKAWGEGLNALRRVKRRLEQAFPVDRR